MKKTLLVAAMMASFTGAAVAQNSVTLYGRLAPSLVYQSIKVDNTAATTLGSTVNAGTFNQFQMADGFNAGGAGGLWGLRGVEDIGNGLKVSFQFEQAINSTIGSAPGQARVAAVTVSNAAWGSIGFGRDIAAADTIMAGVRAIGGLGLANANVSLQSAVQRYSNQVKYLSPTISGFRLGVSYAFSTVPITNSSEGIFGTANKNRALNAGLRYANGPVVIAGLYTQLKPNSNLTRPAISNFLVGGSYDLKVVKLHAAYGQSRNGLIGRNTLPGSFGGSSATLGSGGVSIIGAKTDQYAIGLTAPVGPGAVAFSYAQMKPKGVLNVASASTQTNMGISYNYDLSKRTSVSVGYAYTQNLGMIKGITSSEIGGGILHTF